MTDYHLKSKNLLFFWGLQPFCYPKPFTVRANFVLSPATTMQARLQQVVWHPGKKHYSANTGESGESERKTAKPENAGAGWNAHIVGYDASIPEPRY